MRAFRFAAVFATSVLLSGCLAGPDQSPPNEQDEVGASVQELNGAAAVWTAQGPNAILGGQVENLRDGTEAVGAPSNNVVSGAVHTIIAHPTNANTLWVGTVNGGVWRTNNALTAPPTWVNQTPNLAGLSIGALALDFSQCPGANCGNALAAGTGAQSSAGGISSQLSGIAVTNNGGGAWNLTATQPMANPDVSGLFIQGPVIVVSTRNGGVFRSANTGATWSAAIAPGMGAAGRRAFDLVRDPSNANRLYLATQGGGGAVAGREGVFVSNNTGQTWTNVSINFAALQNAIDAVDAAGNATNTNLELAVGTGGRVYAAIVQNNQPAFIAFSDNQGTNWTQMELPLYPSITGLAGMIQQVQPSACGVAPCPILITTVMPHNLPTTSPGSTTVQLGVRLTNNMGTVAPANGDFRATIVCNNDPPPANTLPCVNPSTQFVLLGSALAAGSGCGGPAPQPACTGNYTVWNTTSPSLKPGGQGGVHFSIAVHPTNQNIVFVGGDRQNEVRPAGNYIGAAVFTGTLWRGNTAVAPTLPLQPLPSAQWANLTHNTVCPASPPGCGLPPNPPCCYATPGLPAGTIPGGGTGLGGLGIAGQGSAPHADSREIAFDANNNLIEANDGGLVRRTNPLTSQGDWTSISGNLQITEQHDIAFDAVNRLLVSGNQDTGVSRQIVNCGTPGNPPCTTWTADNGNGPGQIADGADVVIDDVTLAGAAVPGSIYYTSSQNLGGFVRSTVLSNGAAPTVAAVGLCPAGTAPPGSCAVPAPVLPQFYSPLALNLNNRQQLVIAGQANIWESFTQGRNVQNVGAVNNANAIAYGHPQNANLLVATMPATAAAAGGVFVRTAAFGSGTPDAALAAIALPAAGFNPIDVTVDPAAGPGNVSFFVIGFSAVGAPQLFRFTITSVVGTAVAGNWTNLSGDLAAVNPGVLRRVVYVNAALGGAPNSKFFIAADRGVFVAADPATVATPGGNVFWNEVGANSLPNAPVFDMEYERTGVAANTLFVGTMGRGSWSLPNASTLDLPPIASCRAGVINVNANAMCQGVVAAAAIDNGSLDPDGNAVMRTVLPAGPFPLGMSMVTLQVSNAGGVETCTAQINVVDSTGPVITASNTTIPRCAPAPEEVTIPASAVDNCSAPGAVTLSGQLTAVDGVALPTPVAINGSTRRAVLPVGANTIVWNATDALGLPAAAVTQTVTITEADTAAACCGTKTVVEGNALPELIFLPFPNEYCAFGRGSFDTITGGLAPDLLSGGDGNDFVTGGSTNDVLLGRAGLDILRLPIGGGRVYGGAGSDVIDQSFGGSLYGGPGDDNIDGLFNSNIIYPGSGRDSVEGGPGDDTVIIYDVCELEPLETLDGGLGNDTLITPVSLLELGLRGVIVVGFNNIVVDASNRHLSDCF